MKAISVAILLLLTVASGVLGVIIRPGDAEPPAEEPRPIEETPAPPTPNTEPEEWMLESPMRLKMRKMWLNAGVIGARTTSSEIEFEGLETAAAYIARTAGGMADMWRTVRDHNREIARHAEDGNWYEAVYESQRAWTACTDCHVENWSPHARGFLPETVEDWLDYGYATEKAAYDRVQHTAPQAWVDEMRRLMGNHGRAAFAVERRDVEQVMSSTHEVEKIIRNQLVLWEGVERHASKIVEISALNRINGIREQYNHMTGYCIGCHATYVTDGRVPLNPLPFPPFAD